MTLPQRLLGGGQRAVLETMAGLPACSWSPDEPPLMASRAHTVRALNSMVKYGLVTWDEEDDTYTMTARGHVENGTYIPRNTQVVLDRFLRISGISGFATDLQRVPVETGSLFRVHVATDDTEAITVYEIHIKEI